MTKLQLLNAFLSERLAALVREVVAAVEDAVSEYREETARTRRENESLRRQLRDILLLEAETEWLSKGRATGTEGRSETVPFAFYSQLAPKSGRSECFPR